jgi:oxygen-independent coproporphyrinogen-3 oxidase
VRAKSVSLYIHVPFCASFCDYCDFYSVKAENDSDTRMDTFVKSVITDIKYQLDFFAVGEIVTVYIGGGTPSVLGGRRIRLLLDELRALSNFMPKEFTVEANPESADEDFLSACREGGVNRLSLGVQSFFEPSRRAVNRKGQVGLLEGKLALVSRFFPDEFSADLIAGLPYQTEKTVLEDVKRLLAFNPAHVSLYSLSVESGTPLERKLESKTVTLPAADDADALWLAGHGALLEAGFDHYEVSNFALGGKRSVHNIRYWQMESWLGAGPAASGTLINENDSTARRFTFACDVDEYNKEPSIHKAVCEELDKTNLMKESLLMGYRYREGPDEEKFRRRFGLAIEDCIPKTIARWKNRDKMLFLNSFLCEAFTELDN